MNERFAVHFETNGQESDGRVVREYIRPAIERLEERTLIDRFHFFRYGHTDDQPSEVRLHQLADAEGHLIADFDLEGHEVYAYRKVPPKQMRPEKSGRSIIIKNPDRFIEWLDVDPLGAERSSWMTWISEKLT